MDLVVAVYRLSGEFPRDERFGLTAHVRRSAVSVPSNIAEGYSRPTKADLVRFLEVALDSLNELDSQLALAIRLNFVSRSSAGDTVTLLAEVQRITAGLINSLNACATMKVSR